MAARVTWQDLITVPSGTAVADLPWNAEHAVSTLFHLGDEAFIIAIRGKSTDRDDQRVASAVLWAPSRGAARRALFLDVEGDDGAIGRPPQEMLVGANAISYEAIIAEARANGLEVLAAADYRAATDGRFVQRVLRCSPWAFYFRSRSGKGECPYAVMRDLRT